MLGLAPSQQAAAVAAPNVYGTPLTGAIFASLGMLAFSLLTFMPTTFDGTSVLRTLIALSLTAGGIFGVLIGYVGVSTRIEVGPDGVVVAAPGWRACPYPPVRQFELRWADLRAVRHRTEVYRIGPFPCAARSMRSRPRASSLSSAAITLWDLEPVLIDIVHRAGCRWCEDGEIEASLLRTLRHGAPPWPGGVAAPGTRAHVVSRNGVWPRA